MLRAAQEQHGHSALDDRPEVRPELAVYWDAFWMMSASRPYMPGGMGPPYPQAIPISEIASYMHLYEIRDPDFVTIIRRLDVAYLKKQREKIRARSR